MKDPALDNRTTVEPPTRLSRRKVLHAGAALPLAMAVPALSAAPAQPAGTMDAMMPKGPDSASTPLPAPATPVIEGLETLNATEMETLEAVCARLIPGDERSPGARQARAAHYIDRALAGPLMKQRSVYAAGLSALDAEARNGNGQSFAKLPPADQDALLHRLEGGNIPGFLPNSAAWFSLVRGHTIEGMFCDPYYGGNANFIGWDLVGYPGLRMMVTAEDQRMIKPKPLRESAYSSNMFGWDNS